LGHQYAPYVNNKRKPWNIFSIDVLSASGFGTKGLKQCASEIQLKIEIFSPLKIPFSPTFGYYSQDSLSGKSGRNEIKESSTPRLPLQT